MAVRGASSSVAYRKRGGTKPVLNNTKLNNLYTSRMICIDKLLGGQVAETIIQNEQQLNAYIDHLRLKLAKDKRLKVSAKSAKARTLTQNRTLHLFCTHLAKALNDGGFDFRTFIKEGYPVPFNEALVKEYIWGPIQKAITGFDSSTKPTPKQYSEIYDALNTKLIEHGLFCPWPCKEEMIAKSYHE